MNESKIMYLAGALSGAALIVSIATFGLSAIGNSSKIEAIADSLVETSSLAELNSRRVDELDIGLVALATTLNIHPEDLARTIQAVRDHQAQGTVQPQTITDTPEATASNLASSHEAADEVLPPTELSSNAQNADDGSDMILSIEAINEAPKQLSIQEVDAVLAKRISEKWFKPADAKESLSAVIQLQMNRDGQVASVKLVRKSGNTLFDNSVVNAVTTIGTIVEVAQLSDEDYKKAYESRNIQFTPNMGRK